MRFVVFDEADRLLSNATLQDDLAVIVRHLPAERQTLLFSATMPDTLEGPIASQLRQPIFKYEVGA